MEGFMRDTLSRIQREGTFRSLTERQVGEIDFASNDYLGIAKEGILMEDTRLRGATGSRLISGNRRAMTELEQRIAYFHKAEAALIFNTGFEANGGMVGAFMDRHSVLLYDAWIHRSIREAVHRTWGRTFAFAHNDLDDLARKLHLVKNQSPRIFVCVESVYSMDGDLSPLRAMSELCEALHAQLIVDEAHATGVIGAKGEGLVQDLGLEKKVFLRMHTFSKALGLMGAVVLGSCLAREYLINFAPSFIFTTALPPLIVRGIEKVYDSFPGYEDRRAQLSDLIHYFSQLDFPFLHPPSPSPIQSIFCEGNEKVKTLARYLRARGFFLIPIRSPTVPKGRERLRVALHAFNTKSELDALALALREFNA